VLAAQLVSRRWSAVLALASCIGLSKPNLRSDDVCNPALARHFRCLKFLHRALSAQDFAALRERAPYLLELEATIGIEALDAQGALILPPRLQSLFLLAGDWQSHAASAALMSAVLRSVVAPAPTLHTFVLLAWSDAVDLTPLDKCTVLHTLFRRLTTCGLEWRPWRSAAAYRNCGSSSGPSEARSWARRWRTCLYYAR
jgi:hypothetical protein